MILFENKKNAHLIHQYLNQEILFEDCDVTLEGFSAFERFDEELRKVSKDKQGNVLANLMAEYELHPALKKILINYELVENTDGELSVAGELTLAFQELMLEVTRKVMSAKFSEERKLWVNRKLMAERIMQLFALRINHKDPEIILIYNHMNGRWEDGKIAISRLIIELTHYLGTNVVDSWTAKLERSIVDILLRKVEMIDPSHFNRTYYPFANVTLDTNTVSIVEHSPHYLATMGSKISYDLNAACPVFETFLSQVFEDGNTIQFVQEWFGYTLFGGHKANSLLIGVGSGANGKSTLFDVLAQLVGLSNVSSVPLSNFNSEFGLEPLIGMKLNLATESDADAFKTGKLKALTAGEAISVNRKNKPEITIILPTKLVFLVNELPILSDSSMGFERRLIILPFNQTFTPNEQDKDLSKKLTAELEGILNWAIIGLKRLMANNFQFTVSNAMDKAKESYFGVGNPVERFIKEKVTAAPSKVIESTDLINAYRLWMTCKEYPYKGTDSPQVFWRMFEEAAHKALIDYIRAKSNGKSVVRDIALKVEA
jgi:putative DNA primase/helicase